MRKRVVLLITVMFCGLFFVGGNAFAAKNPLSLKKSNKEVTTQVKVKVKVKKGVAYKSIRWIKSQKPTKLSKAKRIKKKYFYAKSNGTYWVYLQAKTGKIYRKKIVVHNINHGIYYLSANYSVFNGVWTIKIAAKNDYAMKYVGVAAGYKDKFDSKAFKRAKQVSVDVDGTRFYEYVVHNEGYFTVWAKDSQGNNSFKYIHIITSKYLYEDQARKLYDADTSSNHRYFSFIDYKGIVHGSALNLLDGDFFQLHKKYHYLRGRFFVKEPIKSKNKAIWLDVYGDGVTYPPLKLDCNHSSINFKIDIKYSNTISIGAKFVGYKQGELTTESDDDDEEGVFLNNLAFVDKGVFFN